MRFRFLLVLAFILVFSFSSCKKEEVVVKDDTPSGNAIAEEENKTLDITTLDPPSTLSQKFSYVYGYQQASSLFSAYDLDAYYIAKGVIDGASGSGFYTHDEMQNILSSYLELLQENNMAELEKIKARNLEKAETFLAANKERKTVVTTSSGLQYEILKEGNGKKSNPDSTVNLNYQLMLLSGEVVDSSYSRGVPSRLDLSSSLIPGFKETVLLMKEGDKIRAWLHPSIGYGVNGATKIDPNELLIFDIELISVE